MSISEERLRRYIARCREMSEGGKYTWWSELADLLESLSLRASIPPSGEVGEATDLSEFVDKATAWDELAKKNAEIARLKALLPIPQPTNDREVADKLRLAVLSCPHTITSDEVVLRRTDKATGNALNQLGQRILAALPSNDREQGQ